MRQAGRGPWPGPSPAAAATAVPVLLSRQGRGSCGHLATDGAERSFDLSALGSFPQRPGGLCKAGHGKKLQYLPGPHAGLSRVAPVGGSAISTGPFFPSLLSLVPGGLGICPRSSSGERRDTVAAQYRAQPRLFGPALPGRQLLGREPVRVPMPPPPSPPLPSGSEWSAMTQEARCVGWGRAVVPTPPVLLVIGW